MKQATLFLILALTLVACGDKQTNTRTTATTTHEAVGAQAPTVAVETTPPIVEEMVSNFNTIEGPCGDRVSEDLTVDVVRHTLDDFVQCDPTGEYFDTFGRIKNHEEFGLGVGRWRLMTMQNMTRYFMDYWDAFEELPVLTRRSILETAGPTVAKIAVNYLHSDHIQEWILDVNWERDVANINPDLYLDTDWPEDRTERIAIDGYGNVSKIEFYVRMFWRRRGHEMFELTKKLVTDAKAST